MPDDRDAAEVQGVLARELTEVIARFTQTHPLLFITEDLHWADLATLRLMARFPRVHTPTRVLWLGSFRLTQVVAEDHPLNAIRQELRLHRLCSEVALETFSESEVGEYLQSRTAQVQVPEAFVRRLHAHTDGLPLFVANVVDALMEQRGDGSEDAAAWLENTASASLPVPDNLTGAIEKQIGRLPAEVRALLAAASVCGMEFHARTLAEVLGKPLECVVERCDELVRQRYWLRHVAIVELADGSFDRLVEAVRKEAAWRQKLARAVLGGAGHAAHPYGYHLWLPLTGRHADNPDALAAALALDGLSAVPSERFAIAPGAPGAMRISLGGTIDRRSLSRALHRLSARLWTPGGPATDIV